ncbi:hypothetical protein FO519_006662 [Halicephalobus sp. NKZ332]|nr:hypothetical protein FO519_006662 [Halicephalobus sp. NKZ332]
MSSDQPSSSTSEHDNQKSNWITTIKLACTATTATFFGLGVRAAWKQGKPMDPAELSKAKVLGGVGFASKALGIATVITVSGFSLLVLGISSLLDVHTPTQFGQKVKDIFGDKFRISKGDSQSYETLTELFEAVSKEKEKKEAQSIQS